MSERRINLPTKESMNLHNQSRNHRRSKSTLEINLPILENNSQKTRTFNRISAQPSRLHMGDDILYTKNNIEQEQSHKNPKVKSLDSYLSETNNLAQQEEEKNIWQRVDELIKRIKFKKYIRTFLSLSRIRLYKNLTPTQLMQINDLSIYEKSTDKRSTAKNSIRNSFTSSIVSRASEHNNKYIQYLKDFQLPIFLPHSYAINMWQLFKIFSIVICFFFYLISFTIEQQLSTLLNLNILGVCQICLIIDIFVTINTGIYIRGVLCTNRKDIFNFYKSSLTFYCDIGAVFSTTLYFLLAYYQMSENRVVQGFLLPIVLKLNDFQVIIKKIKVKFQLDRKMQNLIELFNLMKNIVLISHIFACIWLRTGLYSQTLYDYNISSGNDNNTSKGSNSANSWIDLMNLGNQSWDIQYINSYYYIVVTMSTVGYGDIRPTNPMEIGVCIFLVLTCCVMFGFTMNSIGEIFQDFFTQEKVIQEKRYIIASYMDKNHIDPNTRKSIFEYLEYYWKESTDENIQEENKIISQLSDNLKEELLIQSNKLILKESKVLKENFSSEILAKCIPIISEQKLTPGEILIDEEEGNLDCSIYFVLFGELEVYHGCMRNRRFCSSNNRGLISVLKRGDSFGERSFFSGDCKCLNIKSNQFSKILKIRRGDFIKVLQEDKEQYEKFMYLQDKLNFQSEIIRLHMQCRSCKSNLHEIGACPSLHYIPKKMKIYGVNQMTSPQDRSNLFIRNKFKKTGTLENLYYNTQSYLDFLENQFDELENYELEHLHFSSFDNKAKYLVQPDDEGEELNSVKNNGNGYDLIKLKQTTTEFGCESPFLGPDGRKKLSFKKKTTPIMPSPIMNMPLIYQNEEFSRDMFSKGVKHQSVLLSFGGFELDNSQKLSSDQPQNNQIYQDEFGFNSIHLNENNPSAPPHNHNHRFTMVKRQLSKDIISNQHYERTKHKPDSLTRLTQKMNLHSDQFLNKQEIQQDNKSSVFQITEENQFDLLQGKMDKYENFQYYYPKHNIKNILNMLNPSSQVGKKKNKQSLTLQIKENSVVVKLNKNIHQLLKERDIGSCRSIPRSKVKLESETNLDKLQISPQQHQGKNGKSPFDKQLKQISIQLNLSHQNVQLDHSHLEEDSNYFQYDQDESSVKVEIDDPNTPPRNEYTIHQIEPISLRQNKNQTYNFGSYDTSFNQIVKQQN